MEKSEIVRANLEKMLSSDRDGMIFSLSQKINGNAPDCEGHPCITAEFRYAPYTGEIKSFNKDSFKKKDLFKGTFKFRYHGVTEAKFQDLYELVEVDLGSKICDNEMEIFRSTGELYNSIRTKSLYTPREIRINLPH